MISIKDYCSQVCGGKCCTLWEEGVTCPHLTTHKLCGIYEKRFGEGSPEIEAVGFYKKGINQKGDDLVHPFYCGRIEKILSANLLPEWIKEKCCYAHPKLLEGNYEKKSYTELDDRIFQIGRRV